MQVATAGVQRGMGDVRNMDVPCKLKILLLRYF